MLLENSNDNVFSLELPQCLASCWTNTEWPAYQRTSCFRFCKVIAFSINSSTSVLLSKKYWMHFAEFKSQGIITLKREHNTVQPHCLKIIELWILKLAAESGCTVLRGGRKGPGGTAWLSWDVTLPASERMSEEHMLLVVLLELLI